jgi:hypothetical protein
MHFIAVLRSGGQSSSFAPDVVYFFRFLDMLASLSQLGRYNTLKYLRTALFHNSFSLLRSGVSVTCAYNVGFNRLTELIFK